MPSPLFRRLPSRRTFLAVVPLALVAAVSLGCAQKENSDAKENKSSESKSVEAGASPSPDSNAKSDIALKVGLITPGKISDKGWSQSAYTGLQKIKADMSAETSQPVEEPAPAQVESVLRNLAQDDNTLVFAHGSEYDNAAKKVAVDFPKTTFVVMGGRSVGENLEPIQFAGAQGTYLAGMLAAGMTKTGKLGLIGPQEIPIIKESFAAFEKGAKAVRPDVQVTTTYLGSEDIAKGKQQAQSLLDAGVDVIMHNANAAGQGVAQAVQEKPGAMFIGANADQKDLATAQNLGSFILDVPSAMEGVAKAVAGGKTGGEAYKAGVKDKAVGFAFNPSFKGTIPADLKAKIEKAESDMAAGTLVP